MFVQAISYRLNTRCCFEKILKQGPPVAAAYRSDEWPCLNQESSPFGGPSLALFHFNFCCTARPAVPSQCAPACCCPPEHQAVSNWVLLGNEIVCKTAVVLGFVRLGSRRTRETRVMGKDIQNEVERFLERIVILYDDIIVHYLSHWATPRPDQSLGCFWLEFFWLQMDQLWL